METYAALIWIRLRNIDYNKDKSSKNQWCDPDPVGSAFIWIRGSRGIKLREKKSLTNKFLIFFLNYIFQVWN